MGFLKKLLGIKPKTVGDAFRAVKKHFNAVGDDLAHIPGQRLYKTPSGNRVLFDTTYNGIRIDKVLDANISPREYKAYVGTPAGIARSHHLDVKPGDKTVKLLTTTESDTFKALGTKKSWKVREGYGNIGTVERIDKQHYAKLHADVAEVVPKVKKTYSFNTQTMPYAKAVSMGLKV